MKATLRRPQVPLALTVLALAALCGCQRALPKSAPPRPAEVLVSWPVEGQITDFEDFTGRTDAFHSVDIRARVTGYLTKRYFKDGSEVKKEDPLFEIDPRPYKAALLQAQASLASAVAKNKLAEIEYKRAANLVNRGSYSREEYDQAKDTFDETHASADVARAVEDLAQLNMDFTTVRAPLDGRISRRMVDVGNMVMADNTVLTSIVALDPMYVYFEVDERTLLRLRRLIGEGKLQTRAQTTINFLAALADEDEFTHKGTVDFSDNKVDPNTGTLQLRGVIENPKPHLLSPGLFVRVRLPIGKPYQALMVPEQALGTDQGRKFVYVVNEKNEVEFHPVKTAP